MRHLEDVALSPSMDPRIHLPTVVPKCLSGSKIHVLFCFILSCLLCFPPVSCTWWNHSFGNYLVRYSFSKSILNSALFWLYHVACGISVPQTNTLLLMPYPNPILREWVSSSSHLNTSHLISSLSFHTSTHTQIFWKCYVVLKALYTHYMREYFFQFFFLNNTCFQEVNQCPS